MSFEHEYAKQIQRYFKEVNSQELTIDEIMQRPRWKRVWYWWKALEYYEGKPMPELTLDEVKDVFGN